MRIAYICMDGGIPIFGSKGASIHVQEMLRAFSQLTTDITLFSPRIEGDIVQDLASVRQVPFPPIPKGDAKFRAMQSISYDQDLEAALLQHGPFDLIYERHALYSCSAMEFAQKHAIPSVLEINAPLIEEQEKHRSLALPQQAISMAKQAICTAKTVIAVSPAVGAYAQEVGSKNVHVIANAISPNRFQNFRQESQTDRPFCVGFLGSLKPWHDLPTLIEAFAHLRTSFVPDATLQIIGDGPERAKIEEMLSSRNLLDAVKFSGLLAADKVPAMLSSLDVGTAPYADAPDFYFSPLKIYEYMAAGLPVIASHVGHLPDLIKESDAGLIVPASDPHALAHALAHLANTPMLARKFGQNARNYVLENHTWDKVAAKIIHLSFQNQKPS